MNISQMINNSGNAVANQFTITTDKGVYFQSYGTLIAFIPSDINSRTVFTDSWNYSRVTLKHLKIFLSCSLSEKDLQKRIESGDILLVNELKIV